MSAPNVVPFYADQRVVEDVTERDLHAIIGITGDFASAIVDARSVSRCLQLRERRAAAIGMLETVQREALRKADSF